MNFFIQWAIDPEGKRVAVHIAWFLIWVVFAGGLSFVGCHALYVSFIAKSRQWSKNGPDPDISTLPKRVARHSLIARIFHWVMAAAMFTLLFTGFLPKVGMRFSWVTYHWIAGAVLTVSVAFHVIHASLWLDFWAIWPDRIDWHDAAKRLKRFFGWPAPPPWRFAKYPLESKLFHVAVIACGLSAIGTGVFMLSRVGTISVLRNPYPFTNVTWGWVYVFHGLAGVGFIALVMMHVYFAIRPENRPIAKSMIFGWMSREFYLKRHDPARWILRQASDERRDQNNETERHSHRHTWNIQMGARQKCMNRRE